MLEKLIKLTGKKWFPVLLVVILPFIVYSNSFDNAFHYDDMHAFVNNDAIKDIKNIPGFFSTVLTGEGDDVGYRPLLAVSFALNYYVGGLNPAGYHLFNLLFHALNGLLIFYILLSMQVKKGLPLVAALLFVLHPVHSEAVNYIHARSSILATFFFLGAMYLFIKFLATGRKLYYAGILVAFIAGVFTKEISFTLPVILLLYDYFFISNNDLKKLLKNLPCHLPLFMLLGIYLFFRVFIVQNIESPGGRETFFPYLLTQFGVVVHYIRLLFYPVNLAVERFVPLQKSLNTGIIFPVLQLAAIIFAAIKLSGKHKLAAFGILWFFITLLPTSSFMPLIIRMNEHRLYLPGVGFAIAGALAVTTLYSILQEKKLGKPALYAFIVFLAIFSARIYNRNADWKDLYSLWSKNIQVSPESFRAHNNLGSYYDKIGEYDKAMKEYEECIKLNPETAATYNNLGILYYRKKLYDKAILYYKDALTLRNDYGDAINNLGIAYASKGLLDAAIAEFSRGIELNSGNNDIYKNLGLVYKMKGEIGKAVHNWEQYLQLYPDAPDAAALGQELDRLRKMQ